MTIKGWASIGEILGLTKTGAKARYPRDPRLQKIIARPGIPGIPVRAKLSDLKRYAKAREKRLYGGKR